MRKILYLVMLGILVTGIINNVKTSANYTEEAISSDEAKSFFVYFPRVPDMELVAEKIELQASTGQEEKIKRMINKLIDGSEKKELVDVIPSGSKLNNVYVRGNIAFIDFSEEFVENHPGGSIGEYNTIYSIVNSVTGLDGVEQVMFLIDGKKQATYKGHFQFDTPICRDDSLIDNE